MKITIMTTPDMGVYECRNDLSGNKASIDFAVQCVLQGFTDVSVLGEFRKDTEAGNGIENLDSFGIDRSQLRILPARADSRKAGKFEAAHKQKLDLTDWQHLSRRDYIVVSSSHPNFTELIRHKKLGFKPAIDFFNVPAYYDILNFMSVSVVSFIHGTESAVDFFKDYSAYLGMPILIAAHSGRITVLYKGQIYRMRPVSGGFRGETVIDWTAFRAAFFCGWLKSKDIRKAMRQAAGAAFHAYTYAGVV
jgi:hypothetical protein